MLPCKCSFFCPSVLQHDQDAAARRSPFKKRSKLEAVSAPFHGLTDTLLTRTGFSLAPSHGGRWMLHFSHLMAVVSTHGLNHTCDTHLLYISKTWQNQDIEHLDHF